VIADQARRYGDRPYLEDARTERAVSYRQLADAVAAWRPAILDGDRVLLDIDDPLRFAATHLSVLAAGARSVPIDPDAPAADVARTVRATQVATVISDRSERWADGRLTVHSAEPPSPAPATPVGRGPGAVLMQTSGSTGDPKLIELGEDRLLHVGSAVARQLRLTEADRGFNPLPLFHINGQVVGLLATLIAGGTLVLDRRFRRTGFWALLAEREISWVNAVPAILTILSRDRLPEPWPALRLIRSASAPLPVPVGTAIAAALAVPIIESYGMTEAASQITSTALDEPVPAGSVGRPVGAELQVRGEDGEPAPVGTTGTVWIRGAGIVTSYADGRGGEKFDAAGWLDSGDLGRLDEEGNLFLAGRADDVINRGGELVYPREIEEILLADPRVSEAVVVAAPHDVLGQVPVAQLVHVPELTEAEVAGLVTDLEQRCAEELSRFKRPVSFAVVDSFPRASVGKIRRHLVRSAVSDPSAAAP